MKGLSPEQREAINEIGFGCLLELDITQICGDLGIWLVRNINPYSLTLSLAPNSSFCITEVDVYLALKLPCGPKYVEEAKDRGNDEVVEEAIINWKKRWGVRKGVTAPVTTTMPDKILTHGHGDNFKVDFVIYTFSNLLYGHQARHCNYKLLMALLEPSQICNFNWCEYVIRALVKAVKEFRKNPSGFFCGPLIVVLLLYLDRVEFESSTVERKFPILLGWDDKKVTERKNNELRAGGYGQGCVVPPMNLIKLYQLGYVPQQDFVRLKQILMNLPRLYNQREGGPSVDIDAIPQSTDVGERRGEGDQGTSSSQIHEEKKAYIESVLAVNKKLSTSLLEWNEVMNKASKFFPCSKFLKQIPKLVVHLGDDNPHSPEEKSGQVSGEDTNDDHLRLNSEDDEIFESDEFMEVFQVIERLGRKKKIDRVVDPMMPSFSLGISSDLNNEDSGE
ncbi:uncharacterized protein LOC141629566 [Silene latifolia]|uniref:uncharacterized protein LOC141629566 n=1 Tax=Silene latifolia TaxID=37657 RepID=UPI003D7813DC